MKERSQRQPPQRSLPRLPRAVRWTLCGLATLPLLALTVSAGVYFASVYHLLHAHLVPIAEAELTRQTGHEVRIGGADFSRRGALVLTDIAISNKATFAAGHGEATLAAHRLTIDYNLHALLFDSGNAAHALGDITLEQPSLLVERYSDRFNFSDFFKPKTKHTTKPFVGRVLVHQGLLRFRDFNAPDRGKRPALNTLASVEGTIDFFSERYVYFDVRGVGTKSENRFRSLIVNGDVSRLFAGLYRGHVVAANADAAYWTDYFKAFSQARIVSGRADADVTLAKLGSKPPPGLPLDLSGTLAVRHVTILASNKKLLALPLKDLNGTMAFTGAGLSVDARALLAGQPLAVSGTVFDFAAPQIAASASSPRLDPVRLASALPFLKLPPGFTVAPGPVKASFTGTPSSPTITVNATLPAVVYLGNQATNLVVQATYANKVLSVPTATFRLNGSGQAALRGTLDTTGPKPVLLMAGAAQGIDLAALRLPPTVNLKSLKLGGRADVQFLADNQGRPLSVVANVSAANLHLRETTLHSVTGRVAWTQGQAITLTRATVRDSAGAAAVSGTIPAGGAGAVWNLNVRTAGLDVAGLLRPYSHLALGGRAVFDGKVIGPANAPQVVGAARLIEPRYGRYSANLITGQVTANTKGIRLQGVTVRRFPTEATLNGTITDIHSANPALALAVNLSEGDIADFLHLAESASAPSPKTARILTASLPNLTGTAEGRFEISGRLQSPIVSGHTLVTDATVGDYRIDEASADVRYAHDILSVEHGLIKSGAATLTASGKRTASGVLRASFTASGIDLVRFHQLLDPYADVTGTAALSGQFYGTPQAPHVALNALDIPDLVINRQKFAPFSLAGRYDDGVFTQTGAPWRFLVTVPADYAAEAGGQVEYDVDALHLTLPTTAHPKRAAFLALTAAIPASAPERLSHVFTTLRGTLFARTPSGTKFLSRLADLPQPISGTFALPHISVGGPLSALTAQVDMSAGDLTLGGTKVGGLSAHMHYTAGENPSGAVTADAQKLLVAGVPIGAASADADYHDRIITVHKFQATSERAFLSASGRANLDGDIAASLDASNIPLASLETILPSLVPYFRPSDPLLKVRREALLHTALGALPREVSALSLNASGPTRSPNLVASVSLSTPTPEEAPPPAAPPEKSAKDKKSAKGKKSKKEPVPTEIPAAAPVYALDSIRSGTITLASTTPDGPKILTVDELSAFKGGHLVATLSGSLPLIGAENSAAAALLPDQDLHAVLKVQDLAVLAGFSPGALDPKKTGGQLSVTANFGSGQLSGLATLTDASVGLSSFDTSVNKINGIVVLGDNKAAIQSLTGQSSKGGSFSITGQASLAGASGLDLKLTAKDLTLDENSKQNVLYEKFSSGLKAKINGAISIVGPLLTPKIATPPNAPIVVSDATGTLPSPSDTSVAPGGPPSFDPFFDVALQLGGGKTKTVSVRSSLLRADSSGPVQLGGRLSAPKFRAALAVTRGQFILPPSTLLKIVKPSDGGANTVTVEYPQNDASGVPGVQTNVDITAQATVSPSQATLAQYRSVAGNGIGEAAPLGDTAFGGTALNSGRQRYTITVHIYGLLGSEDPAKLHTDFTSSPGGLSKAQMLAALVPAGSLVAAAGGGAGGQSILEDQFKTALANVAIPTLLTPITESVASALGLEDLNVAYDPNLPLFVTVTKQLTPKIDVTYSRSFGARGTTDQTVLPPQYTLKLGYDITSRYRIGIATDQQHNNTVTLEGVLKF
jgi:hypothetical protein